MNFFKKKYTQFTRQINAYINFLRGQQDKYNQSPALSPQSPVPKYPSAQVPKYPSAQSQITQLPNCPNKGVSLVLTLLIISTILTGTLLVAETTIRHSQVVKGIEVSEKAYFATKTAIEKISYQVNQNYVDISSYTLSGSFDDGSEYEGTITVDTDCPNPPTECDAGAISSTNAWTVSLEPGESLGLDLDINGATYPTGLQISQTGSEPTDLIIYQCDTGGSPRVCASSITQILISSFPYSLNTSGYAGEYYQIRIINNGVASEIYTLTPTGANLPIGIKIQGTGSYFEYERQLESNIPKWQKFGF